MEPGFGQDSPGWGQDSLRLHPVPYPTDLSPRTADYTPLFCPGKYLSVEGGAGWGSGQCLAGEVTSLQHCTRYYKGMAPAHWAPPAGPSSSLLHFGQTQGTCQERAWTGLKLAPRTMPCNHPPDWLQGQAHASRLSLWEVLVTPFSR